MPAIRTTWTNLLWGLALASLLVVGLPAGPSAAQQIDLDLRTWTQEGVPEWGSWEVGDDGTEVMQTINDSPTFFVSPERFSSATIEGVIEVQTSGDNDYIGFVFGYQGPRAPDTTGYDFLVFNWKQSSQAFSQCDAEEGMSLLRLRGQEDANADYTPSGDAHPALWCHSQQALDDRGYDMDLDVLDTNWGDGTGWEDETEYTFTLRYSPTNVAIDIDGTTVFDVDGAFPAGSFGFYNYSQSGVRYSGFAADGAEVEQDGTDQPDPGEPGVSRIPAATTDSGDVRAAAIETCQVVRPEPNSAVRVLLSRDDAFADALAGSALANFDSCILFTEGGPDAVLDPRVRAEIDRVLTEFGVVVILGGTNAVSQAVEDELAAAGHDLQRFAGPTRYETAVRIASVAQALQSKGSHFEAILAYGEDWPDAVTAGAYAAALGVPVVLTPRDTLHPATRDFLRGGPALDRTWVIGGTAVIADAVAGQVPNPQRVFGGNRMGTAAAIAEQMWPNVPASGEDYIFVNLEHPQGWTLALGAAPLAVALSAPELGMRADSLPVETQAFLTDRGFADLPAAVLLGDLTFISADAAQQVEGAIQPGGSTAARCDALPGQPDAAAPDGTTRVEQRIANLDDVGKDDVLTTYAVDDGAGGTRFELKAQVAAGRIQVEELTQASSVADVRPLGTSPIGTGRPAAFVVENVGASTINVALFGLHDYNDDACDLGRITIPDPTAPLQFPIASGNGLQCRDVDADGSADLVVRHVEQTSGSDYEWSEEAYTWPGAGALQFISRDSGTFTSPEDDDQIGAFSRLDCPGVDAP